MHRLLAALAVLVATPALAQSKPAPPPPILVAPATLGPDVRRFVKVPGPTVVLMNVRVVDGTGGPARPEQAVFIEGGRITQVAPMANVRIAPGPNVIDLTGHTVLPGLVGLHNHMYYIARPNLDATGRSEAPLLVPQMTFTSPRLYLAAGVTTLRTGGSVEPYADLNLKAAIDRGELVGPHMDVTAPYLEGAGSPFIQMHPLKDAEAARRMVAFWAEQGATSFKAYINITRAELKAAIDEAHRRGLKITGHLCSVTYPEAAAMGIDNLEHGFWANTQLDKGKAPDACSDSNGAETLTAMAPGSPEAAALIRLLVEKKVAITSTLPVFEQGVPGHAPLNPKAMAVLSPPAREAYLYARNRLNQAPRERFAANQVLWANNLALERAFVAAGGLLVAGPDPTGNGGVIPGFGDHRGVELLVEAGFTPVEAIRVATLNGATYLGLADRIGSIAAGKNADLLVVKGDPSTTVADIENVVLVFKDGVGYDPDKLLESVRGRYGQY